MITACASHLLIDLPLFGSPALLLAGALVLIARSERRRASSSPSRGEPAHPGRTTDS
jgi:hypothetical protein